MLKVSRTSSSLWHTWDSATLKRKSDTKKSRNAQDYADSDIAGRTIKAKKKWISTKLMEVADAPRNSHKIAQAIHRRTNEGSNKKASEDAKKATANLPRIDPADLPDDEGPHFRDAMWRQPAPNQNDGKTRKPAIKPTRPSPAVAVSSNPTGGSGSGTNSSPSNNQDAARSHKCPKGGCGMAFSRHSDLQQHYMKHMQSR
ncbi:hypothetical protein BOTCAL_0004g00260 [Botryotinia calthae]|uniref:C2H2-type domain-containing protein n=1 Tax=Botryotinia calthae TaxID=38488 RepID=A0A4Y8DK28_9HELO|nr:hypothetical protein BOTCAL_0004g00260 [Botryotinia calthae]